MKSNTKIIFSGLVFQLIFSIICFTTTGTSLHLKPDSVNGKDAFLASSSPGIVFNNHPELSGSSWTCGGLPCFGRGLIQFDLSSIPNGSYIQSAVISFYANPAPSNGNGIAMQGNNQAKLQRVLNSWTENSVTWNNAPNTTSQNEVTLNTSTSSFQNYVNINVKNLVQDMINNPTASFGFLLRLANETGLTTMIFASSDYPDSALWPEITIQYSPTPCLDFVISSNTGSDAYLSSGTPTINFGNHEELSSAAWTCSNVPCNSRGLFSFDLSSIPQNAQVVSASLNLYANPSPTNGNGISMQGNNASWLRRVTSSWVDNSVTWDSMPTTTNQNQTLLAQSNQAFQNYLNIDVTNLVSDMIANLNSSFGFMLILQNETPFASMIFSSSNYPDTTLRPSLTICLNSGIGINKIDNIIESADIFPNPFHNELNLNLNLKSPQNINIELSDILSRKIFSVQESKLNSGNNLIHLPIEKNNINNGIYFLKINAGEEIIIRKIIRY